MLLLPSPSSEACVGQPKIEKDIIEPRPSKVSNFKNPSMTTKQHTNQ